VVTAAVQVAVEENIEFRKGLPHGYLNFMGVARNGESSTQRTDFIEKVKSLMAKLSDHAPIDAAVDQMGKQFIHDALPPVLTAGKYHFHTKIDREWKTSSNIYVTVISYIILQTCLTSGTYLF